MIGPISDYRAHISSGGDGHHRAAVSFEQNAGYRLVV
jgi:hypothetical protein